MCLSLQNSLMLVDNSQNITMLTMIQGMCKMFLLRSPQRFHRKTSQVLNIANFYNKGLFLSFYSLNVMF